MFEHAGEMLVGAASSSPGLYYVFVRHMDPELGSLSAPQTQNRYPYCINNPLSYVDPTGTILETLFDAGCILWDIKELWDHPTWENAGWLLVDIGCAAVPFLPAIGGVARLVKGADKVADIWRPADKAFEGGRAIERTDDISGFFRQMDEACRYPDDYRIFRANLAKITGLSFDKSMQAHHAFPVTFRDLLWDKWGIDVWNPRYGSWVDAVAHGHWSYSYNLKWERFIHSPGVKSIDDVFDFARKLGGMPEYGFKVLF
ncbi:MAG: hypothetical protein A3K60_01375 [Euryarchaeota archaeon RBG_19FT_COMBO_56_21]|nr:MAG: hypothetical protein A3K60_01375 [Euryarchaeota archaeon RBG_19FT_COMBO_56_21]